MYREFEIQLLNISTLVIANLPLGVYQITDKGKTVLSAFENAGNFPICKLLWELQEY